MKKITAFCDYDNYHAFSILEGLTNVKSYHFYKTPIHRVGKVWSVKRSEKIKVLKFNYLNSIVKSDCVIFWGVFSPFYLYFPLFLFSVLIKKNVILISEGFKKEKPLIIRTILFGAISKLNLGKVSVFCVGKGANDDYRKIGFESARFYKFGFFENYNQDDLCHILERKKHADFSKKVELLFVGQLIERKGILELLTFLSNSRYKDKFHINVAGDGELRKYISSSNKLDHNCFTLYGHCDKDKLSKLYAQSDLFVLPSIYEGWGVVVNQALAYGLPVLLSEGVRSGEGFLLDGNGFSFSSIEDLFEKLSTLRNEDVIAMANRSIELAKEWGVDEARKRLLDFILKGKVKNSGPVSYYD